MGKESDTEFIEVREMPLDEWLELVFNPPEGKRFLNVAFPTEKHQQEYIATIDKRSEEDVKSLLYRFLIKSGTLGISDQLDLAGFLALEKADPEMFERMSQLQYYRRLAHNAAGNKQVQPWEGITWVLDLLPHFPKLALEGLNAYLMAHIQLLPDWRIHGLFDALEIIRAKFIGVPGTKTETIQFLLNLQPREFECLIERLYNSMDYETELTPAQKDGGRDVKARKQIVGQQERLLIECKRYGDVVGVEIVRALYGVVTDEKANKGVLITTGRFTKDAQEFAERNSIELINGNELVPLLNEHLGPKWPLHIERYVAESQGSHIPIHKDEAST